MATVTTQERVEELLLRKNQEERAFCKAREELYRTVDRYFRQDLSSTYVKEARIQQLLDECVKTKAEYLALRDVITSQPFDIQ